MACVIARIEDGQITQTATVGITNDAASQIDGGVVGCAKSIIIGAICCL